jgi:hypothetical protein
MNCEASTIELALRTLRVPYVPTSPGDEAFRSLAIHDELITNSESLTPQSQATKQATNGWQAKMELAHTTAVSELAGILTVGE